MVNRRSTSTTPEPILQLQRQLEEFRSSQPGRVKLPDSLWQAAVELARQYGLWPVAHPLRLDYMRLKKRLGEVPPPHRRKAAPPSFIEVVATQPAVLEACVIEFDSARGAKMRIHWKSHHTARLDQPAAGLAGNRKMIQITATMRILVAIEPVDLRKGIDGLAQFCREKLEADPFSACCLKSRTR